MVDWMGCLSMTHLDIQYAEHVVELHLSDINPTSDQESWR
jgi:hypothetical protein